LSRFEALQAERSSLRTRRTTATLGPAAVLLAVAVAIDPPRLTAASVLLSLAGLLVTSCLLHCLWTAVFPGYRRWCTRSAQIAAEIAELRRRVSAIFDKYRARQKGERFKAAYELAGKSLADLEEALSVGMYRERREIFVTAFMRDRIAVRVTASIGSPYRCAAADNPARWAGHLERLGCDEIRQYHNHPTHTGTTSPSGTDFRTARRLKALLGPHGPKLRSLIICWNAVREWKVFEYDGEHRHWLGYEFDASR
jgi:hypothetical protein